MTPDKTEHHVILPLEFCCAFDWTHAFCCLDCAASPGPRQHAAVLRFDEVRHVATVKTAAALRLEKAMNVPDLRARWSKAGRMRNSLRSFPMARWNAPVQEFRSARSRFTLWCAHSLACIQKKIARTCTCVVLTANGFHSFRCEALEKRYVMITRKNQPRPRGFIHPFSRQFQELTTPRTPAFPAGISRGLRRASILLRTLSSSLRVWSPGTASLPTLGRTKEKSHQIHPLPL